MLSPVKIWRNQKKVITLIGQEGKILSWTNIRVPPEGFSQEAPYAVVIVELSDNTRITAQLVENEGVAVHLGDRVKTVLRRIAEPDLDGVIPYGIKVKLL